MKYSILLCGINRMSGRPPTAAERMATIRLRQVAPEPDSTAGLGSRLTPGVPTARAAPARGVFGHLYNSVLAPVGRTVSAPFRAVGRVGSDIATPFIDAAGGPGRPRDAGWGPQWFASKEDPAGNSRFIYDSSKITDLTPLSEEEHERLSEPEEFDKLLRAAGGLAYLDDISTLVIEDQLGFTVCDVDNMFSFEKAFNSPSIRNRVGNAVAKAIAYRLDKELFNNFIKDEQNVDVLTHVINARQQGRMDVPNPSPQNNGTQLLLSSIYAYLGYFKPYKVNYGKLGDKGNRGSKLRLARSLYEFYPNFIKVIMAGIAFVEIEMTTENGQGWRKRLELIDKERQSITNISSFLAHNIYMYIKIKLHQNGRQNWNKHRAEDNVYALNNTRKGVRAAFNRTFNTRMPSFGRANIHTRGIEEKFKGIFEIPTDEEVQSYLTEKEVYHRVDHSHRVYYRNIFEVIYGGIASSTGFYLREMMLDAEVADHDVKEARKVLEEAQRRAVDAQGEGDADKVRVAAEEMKKAKEDLDAKAGLLKIALNTMRMYTAPAMPAAKPVLAQGSAAADAWATEVNKAVADETAANPNWAASMVPALAPKGGGARGKRHTKRRKSYRRRH